MIKIIKIHDKDGKVTYTPEELERLLNEVYDQGFADGKKAGEVIINSHPPITNPLTPPWNGPYYTSTTTLPYREGEITCSNNILKENLKNEIN